MTAKHKRSIYSVLKFIVLALFLVIVMFPFVWMLLTSLKGSQGEIYAFPVKYLPNPVFLCKLRIHALERKLRPLIC